MNMMLLMSHPEFGFTHVYDEREKLDREKKGWAVVEDMKHEEPEKKRGRPKKVSA